MNNYQLYRTNARLGGQVAWNIVLGSVKGDLQVTDFSLSPYSPYTSFTYNEDRDWLRYTHQENVSHLYKQTKGTFYDSCIDSRLSGQYPLIDKIDTKNKVEDYGMYRVSYGRFGKQLAILCPVWLEEFGSDTPIEFEFVVRPEPKVDEKGVYFSKDEEGEEIVISTKRFKINPVRSDNSTSKQASFDKYFYDYVSYISQSYNGIKLIGDDIINIDIHNDSDHVTEYGAVTGLHVESGNIVTKDITSFISNLYDRERPMMETDSLIQNNISDNELIVKQLFNFNFIFNLEDLNNNTMFNLIGDTKLNVDVRVYVGSGESKYKLERRVFDTNYIFLPTDKIDSYENKIDCGIDGMNAAKRQDNNVFNYLFDTDCIDLIKYNRVSQYIHHWSLADNNDYLFNLYSGFANKVEGIAPYFYKSSPNYWDTDAAIYPNALNWCSHINYDSGSDFVSNIMIDLKSKYTQVDLSRYFVDYTQIAPDLSEKDVIRVTNISIKGTNREVYDYLHQAFNTDEIYAYYIDEYGRASFDQATDTSILDCKDVVFIFKAYAENSIILISSKHYEYALTYKYVRDNIIPTIISKYENDEYPDSIKTQIITLHKFFDAVQEPTFIYMHSSLNYRRVDSPVNTSTEIEYTKDNNSHNTLIRYLGKIKPTFAKLEDILEYQFLYYDSLDNDQKKVFEVGIQQRYLPYYPSIKFWYLEPIYTDSSHYKLRNCLAYIVEDRWYDFSTALNIRPTLNLTLYSKCEDGVYYKIEDLLHSEIAKIYPRIAADEQTYQYFLSLYDISSSFEYAEKDGKPEFHDAEKKYFKYVYNVKLTLK